MEIKIQCECGARYKFDIEPVHGRMPTPVKCPDCGADGTMEANQQIRQALGPPSPPPPPAPVAGIPVATAVPVATAAPPPPPRPPGLQISRPTAGTPPPPPPPPPGAYIPPPPMRPGMPAPRKKSSIWPKVLIGVAVAICFCGGGVAYLVHKSLPGLTQFMSEMEKAGPRDDVLNLNSEGSVMLFIRQTNHADVGEACKAYWKENFKKELTFSALTNSPEIELSQAEGEYKLFVSHNNFVRLVVYDKWPAERYEELAKHLSQKLNTLVFELAEVEDPKTEDYLVDEHFGAYEAGARKFHAVIRTKISTGSKKVLDMKVDKTATLEGEEWARANGYEPGPEGSKNFDLSDADKITQKLGMKFSDEDEDKTMALLMKEH